jgi:hypothetical protein
LEQTFTLLFFCEVGHTLRDVPWFAEQMTSSQIPLQQPAAAITGLNDIGE